MQDTEDTHDTDTQDTDTQDAQDTQDTQDTQDMQDTDTQDAQDTQDVQDTQGFAGARTRCGVVPCPPLPSPCHWAAVPCVHELLLFHLLIFRFRTAGRPLESVLLGLTCFI